MISHQLSYYLIIPQPISYYPGDRGQVRISGRVTGETVIAEGWRNWWYSIHTRSLEGVEESFVSCLLRLLSKLVSPPPAPPPAPLTPVGRRYTHRPICTSNLVGNLMRRMCSQALLPHPSRLISNPNIVIAHYVLCLYKKTRSPKRYPWESLKKQMLYGFSYFCTAETLTRQNDRTTNLCRTRAAPILGTR